jgi:hypothetical protein
MDVHTRLGQCSGMTPDGTGVSDERRALNGARFGARANLRAVSPSKGMR